MTAERVPMDWDEPIENDGPAGNYVLLADNSVATFEVVKFKRGTSQKMNSPMAVLTLKITGAEGTTEITENLILNKAIEWKLCQFFTSIGQRKHGETLVARWDEVEGATGIARVTVETFTKRDGSAGVINAIKNFLPPEDAAEAEPEAPPEPSFD